MAVFTQVLSLCVNKTLPEPSCPSLFDKGNDHQLQGGGHLRGMGAVDAAVQRNGEILRKGLGRRHVAQPGRGRYREGGSAAVGVRQPRHPRRARFGHPAL